MIADLEFTIVCALIFHEQFRTVAYPNLKEDYFEDESTKLIFKLFCEFVNKFNTTPTKESLTIDCQNLKNISETLYSNTLSKIQNVNNVDVKYEWLIKTTEEWCQKRALFLSLIESISIAQDDNNTKQYGAIIPILKEAISVSFDNKIGHNYIKDSKSRFEYYQRKEDQIPFDLHMFNKMTDGGLRKKTLNMILAGTGVGKSLCMCHMASAALLNGLNVLYITLEMSEEMIAERIDANLLNINIKELKTTEEEVFNSKIESLANKTCGQLIIRGYPTGTAHVGHFRSLASDLHLKENFRPDIIFVDYLNICASQQYKPQYANSYTIIKGISEELRAFAWEQDVPLMSATQTTRSGSVSSDLDLTDTSESFGLPQTADLMFALSSSEEDEQLGQIMVKQLKNRFSGTQNFRRFAIGADKKKMRLYDIEQSVQESIIDSGTIEKKETTNTNFGGFNFE